jgi:prolyl-tRNA synthetase
MRLSQLFTNTARENPAGETSANAKLLERAGFVYKNSAGVYSYLPLGWRVIQKIATIIREEMNAIGGQELLMQALIEKRYLDATKRWDVEIGFEVKSKKEKEPNFTLGWTHEEVLAEIAANFVNSYKDLPFSAYQIQTKFRNEPRAKSGLLRGREFMMKDLYSFHANDKDLWRFYEDIKEAYHKIFHRCGLKAYYTVAAGGAFTVSNTHEFQVLSEVGEDTIALCRNCEYAENKEISKLDSGDQCPKCKGKIILEKAIEVGNIFPLGTKYSEAFNLKYTDEKGAKKHVVMGSYGIGLGRLMGTAVEVCHDDAGIIWPENISPFKFHLISLEGGEEKAEEIYNQLIKKGAEVLFDDRGGKTAGEKFADADLIGIPMRLLISHKTLEKGSFELKRRNSNNTELIPLTKLADLL